MDIFPVLLQQESGKNSVGGSASSDHDLYQSKAKKLGSKISAMMSNGSSKGQQLAGSAQKTSLVQGPLTPEQNKLRVAAQEFESIFVAQLLSTMRQSSTETDFLGENSTTMKIFNGMLDEKYAMEIAKTGQLGLAEMLIQQFEGFQAKPSGELGIGQELDVLEGFELTAVASSLNLPALLSELNIESFDGLELDQLVQQVIERFSQSVNTEDSLSRNTVFSVPEELTGNGLLENSPDSKVSLIPEVNVADDLNERISADLTATTTDFSSGSEESGGLSQNPVGMISESNYPQGMEVTSQAEILSSDSMNSDVRSDAFVQGDFGTEQTFIISPENLATQLEVSAERIIILPPVENMSQASFASMLAGETFESTSENLSQLRQLQFNLQQQGSSHQSLNQRSLQLQHQGLQQPQFEISQGYAETTQGTQSMVLSWNQIQNMNTSSLANVLSGAQGEAILPTQIVSSDQVIIQIANKLQPQLGRGFQQAVIDLEPPSLGRLHIRLVFEDSTLSAQVQARNGMVSEIVRGNLAQLRNALSEHGIQIDNFHVTSGDSGQQDSWQGFSNWEQDFEHRQYQSSNSMMNNNSYTLLSGSENGQQMENSYVDSSSLGIDHLV